MVHCLNHVGYFGTPNTYPDGVTNLFLQRGHLGVSFFFILSGFILTYNHPTIASKGDYLGARAARILPVYYLSLLFSLPILFTTLYESFFRLMYVTNSILALTLTQAWIPSRSSFWNYPAWTLSCEAFFYVSLIFLLPVLQRLIAPSPARFYLIASGCFFAGLILPIWFYVTIDTSADSLKSIYGLEMRHFVERFPPVRIVEFITGSALCLYVAPRLKNLTKFAPILLLTGVVQVLSVLIIPGDLPIGTYCLPGFALIVTGAAALSFPNLKTARPAVRYPIRLTILLGNASYAFYLLHASVLYYAWIVNEHIFHFIPAGGAPFVWVLFVTVTLVTTPLSILIFLFYEEPARKWLHRRLKQWLESSRVFPAGRGFPKAE